jgi:hypothetical protein
VLYDPERVLSKLDIKLRTRKRNPANGPSRRPDYKDDAHRKRIEWMPSIQNKLETTDIIRKQDAAKSGMNRPVVTVQSLKVEAESFRM